jgi:hypothetical protein
MTFGTEDALDDNLCGAGLSGWKLRFSHLGAVDAPSLMGTCWRERRTFEVVEIAAFVDPRRWLGGAAGKEQTCRKQQPNCEILHLHANAGIKRRQSRRLDEWLGLIWRGIAHRVQPQKWPFVWLRLIRCDFDDDAREVALYLIRVVNAQALEHRRHPMIWI